MDWSLASRLLTLGGMALVGSYCWWRYLVAQQPSVPVDISRYERLQDAFNWIRRVTAKMSPASDGTRIQARAGMHSGFRVLYVMFAPFALLLLGGVVMTAVNDISEVGRMLSGLAILAVMVGGALFFAPRYFDDESRELLDFIEETLDAEQHARSPELSQQLRYTRA